MKKAIIQFIILLILVSSIIAGVLFVNHILKLPFRETNDAFHNKKTSFNLDFLIPGGVNIDEKITIGEVIKIRAKKESSILDKVFKGFTEIIPVRYWYLANLLLFLFWSFLFMTFFRIFTFMGYGRALRSSLFLGGCTYYFMPDFRPGRGDDLIFIGFALLIIIIRTTLKHRKKKRGISRA